MICKTILSDELLQSNNVAVGKNNNKNPLSHLFIYNFCAESFLSRQPGVAGGM